MVIFVLLSLYKIQVVVYVNYSILSFRHNNDDNVVFIQCLNFNHYRTLIVIFLLPVPILVYFF